MSSILENISYVLPVVITAVMVIFLLYRKKTEYEFRKITRSISFVDEEKNETNSNIEKLVTRGDVDLRVLEEITDAYPRHRYFIGRGKPAREIKLERIQNDLRQVCKAQLTQIIFLKSRTAF